MPAANMKVILFYAWQWTKCRARVGVAVLALVSIAIIPSVAADISYVYDDVGRLRAVIDPASDTAVYAYL